MKCERIHKKLIYFIEGDLPREEIDEIGAHLAKCNECAAFAEEMKKTLGVVKLEKPAPVSPFFYTRLKARMVRQREEVDNSAHPSVWERILQPALFSILLLAGIYSGIRIGGQASVEKISPEFAETEVVPFFNELQYEPIETFLME